MHRTAAAFVLALALLLSACGGGDDDAAPTADTADTADTAEQPTATAPAPDGASPAPAAPEATAPEATAPAAAPQSVGTPGMGDGPVVDALIQQFMYDPDPLEIETGTTVVWTNTDQIFHSVTAGTPDNPMPELFDGGTDGRENPPGGEPESFAFTFTAPGTYQYFCTRHPTVMSGTLVVQ